MTPLLDASKFSNISQADTDEGVGEFWDTHDFTEFDNPDLPDVEFTMACAVPIARLNDYHGRA